MHRKQGKWREKLSLQEQLEKVQSDLQKIEERRKELQQKGERTADQTGTGRSKGCSKKGMRKSERL